MKCAERSVETSQVFSELSAYNFFSYIEKDGVKSRLVITRIFK